MSAVMYCRYHSAGRYPASQYGSWMIGVPFWVPTRQSSIRN
ncbi:hypothetical protein [Micromonospora sp. NPDC048830]